MHKQLLSSEGEHWAFQSMLQLHMTKLSALYRCCLHPAEGCVLSCAVLPQNDTITISRHHANDHQVKLAICHALAQSTKLCIYEERVLELVLATKHLPQALATHGTVHVSSRVSSTDSRGRSIAYASIELQDTRKQTGNTMHALYHSGVCDSGGQQQLQPC